MSKRTNIPDNKSILQRIEAELAQSSGTEYLLTDGSVISADVEAVPFSFILPEKGRVHNLFTHAFVVNVS